MIQWKPGRRPCKAPGCRERYWQENPHVKWCSEACCDAIGKAALAKVRANREKAQRAKVKQDRAEHLERKKAIERPKDVRPRTQDAFNAMVRERDYFEPCISCGRHDAEIPEHPTGGKWDCGHFLSRGAHPELAFEELNAHKQCKHCNRDLSGNVTRYEERLIQRIGADKVAWLKGPHDPKKYTVQELRDMIKNYNAKATRLRKIRESSP